MKVRYIVFFLAAAIAVAGTGCGKREPAKTNIPDPEETRRSDEESVKHKVLSFNLEGLTEKGAKKWDVNGKTAEAISETEIKLDQIVAKTYGDDAEATITADSGVYNKSQNNVKLEKNVKATIVNTQKLTQDFTSIPSQAAAPKDSNKGGLPQDRKKSKTIITCDGEVLFDYEHNQAYFNRNVKVVTEDGIIEADRITVNLDPQTRRMRDIVADGNVKIIRGENITYSDRATYIDADKKVVLTGKPKLVIIKEGSGFDGDIF